MAVSKEAQDFVSHYFPVAQNDGPFLEALTAALTSAKAKGAERPTKDLRLLLQELRAHEENTGEQLEGEDKALVDEIESRYQPPSPSPLAGDYALLIQRDDEGDWIVGAPDLPGCLADGKTLDEALENFHTAQGEWRASRTQARLPINPPSTIDALLRDSPFARVRVPEPESAAPKGWVDVVSSAKEPAPQEDRK